MLPAIAEPSSNPPPPWRAWPCGRSSSFGSAAASLNLSPRKKKPALIRGAFFYPPADVVLAGKNEDSWSKHEWFTWPGNQFAPEAAAGQVPRPTAPPHRRPGPHAGSRGEAALHRRGHPAPSSPASKPTSPTRCCSSTSGIPSAPSCGPSWTPGRARSSSTIPVGANHQAPPEYFRTAPRVQYIHSIENWEALERGLRAVHAMTAWPKAACCAWPASSSSKQTPPNPSSAWPSAACPPTSSTRSLTRPSYPGTWSGWPNLSAPTRGTSPT